MWLRFEGKAEQIFFSLVSAWNLCSDFNSRNVKKKRKTHAHTQCIQITFQSILYVHKTCRPNMIDLKIKIRAKWDLELENRCVLLLWKINQHIEIMNLSKYTFRYIYLFICLVGLFSFFLLHRPEQCLVFVCDIDLCTAKAILPRLKWIKPMMPL